MSEINEELYKNHENRPDLAGEHPIGDPLQLAAAIIFAAAVALDYLFFKSYLWVDLGIPFVVQLPIGLAIIGFGGWLALRGIQIVFREYRPEPIMITEGMFSVVRHPIYLGAMLVYVGFIVLTFSLIGIGVFFLVIILYHWLAKHEEELMIGIFGEKYNDYVKNVPMWLPRLFPRGLAK